MRTISALLFLALSALTVSGGSPRHIVRNAAGEVTDVFAGGIENSENSENIDPLNPIRSIESITGALSSDPRISFELVERRESLTATHLRCRQLVDGQPVEGAGLYVSFDSRGTLISFHDRGARQIPPHRSSRIDAASATRAATRLFNVNGRARWVREELEGAAPLLWRVLRDEESGAVILREALFFQKEARVFRANPVTILNDPSLQDRNDSAAAVPPTAYETVDLPALPASGRLVGPFVDIVELDAPLTTPADAGAPLIFDRSQKQFEEVNAYYHLDTSQRYLRSLGFDGSRAVVDRAIRVDVHALSGVDNSFYSFPTPGRGELYFGDGGVDDAEDPDILLHEYAHAMQDSISPGNFGGSFGGEPRALGEGFGDYWAFSSGYAQSVRGGRDPFCVGDWDARCGGAESSSCAYPPGADCLRRVDSTKTMSSFNTSNSRGNEHRNGEIWSSALREIFVDAVSRFGAVEGKRRIDTIVVESHFGVPVSPSYAILAEKMLAADRALFVGSNQSAICGAMTSRGIGVNSCSGPRGEAITFSSLVTQLSIPDPGTVSSVRRIEDTRRITRAAVSVAIRHPRRGDLLITLRAPWGEVFVLRNLGNDAAADVRGTYGASLVSADALGTIAGRSAQGDWELIVEDRVPGNAGVLEGWSLELQLEGLASVASRAKSSASLVLPVVGQTAGANGTNFISDVRIFNDSSSSAIVTAYFTRSGVDGLSEFAAQRIQIPAHATVALNRIVQSLFRTEGVGSLTIEGDVANLRVTSRTYNAGGDGTFGQFIPPVDRSNALTSVNIAATVVAPITNDANFRTNFGVVETSGAPGEVELLIRDRNGSEVRRDLVAVLPFGHLQRPVGELICVGCRLEVRVVSGSAVIAAYGSVVDNRSGDAIFIPGARRSSSASTRLHLPAAIDAPGANGTRFLSDLYVENPTTQMQTVELRLIQSAGVITRQIILDAGAALFSSGYLSSIFDVSGTGRLEILSPGALYANSRIWNDSTGGSFGQFVPSWTESELLGAGDRATLIQIESSESFRTNIGFAEVSGVAATILVRLYDGAGIERFATTVGVPAGAVIQQNLQQLGAPFFTDGRIDIQVSGAGRIAAYASVVDNRTGDPIFIPAKRS